MPEYKSSSRDFESFLRSSMWSDMVYDIEIMIEDLRDILENPSIVEDYRSEDDAIITAKRRGSLESLRQVLDMPKRIKENIEEDENSTTKEDEDVD